MVEAKMEEPRTEPSSYELKQVVLLGAAASSSIIFMRLGFLFLSSGVIDHANLSTSSISEMMDWAEFIFFLFASYFSASLLVRRYADSFSRLGPSWLPIAVVGSMTFSVSFMLFVWVSSTLTYTGNGPFEGPPLTIWQLPLSIAVFAGLCFVISLFGTTVASAIYDLSRDKNVPTSIITQKH